MKRFFCLFFGLLASGLSGADAQIVRKPIPDKLVVLTFDDASVTQATVVAPTLKKYGFGATFYVCEFPPDFADKKKYMSWEQIRELDRMGFEVANHTLTHSNVARLTPQQFTAQLDSLEARCKTHGINRPLTTFAYPGYGTNPDAFAVLEKKAYQFARVGGARPYDPKTDYPYLIPSYSTTEPNNSDKERIFNAFQEAKNGKIVVITMHGVPDYAHDWVTTPPAIFEDYMKYLHDNQYTVIALRDLEQYVDYKEALRTVPAPLPPVSIRVDLDKQKGRMDPIWAWFGYDEPNYTYMKDGKKLLSELSALSPVPVYVRAHSLLVTGDGKPALKWGSTNVYTEDAKGKPVYDWTIVDKIFDTYIERKMKPMAQIGFMPEALSSKPQPYRHDWQPGQPYDKIYTGWRYPPKDYEKWAELIYQWVNHSVKRYGKKEVESWYWELWNEPDSPYWGGTVDEYNKLYDYSVDAVRRALPTAKVGGPHVTGPQGKRGATFLKAFLDHCQKGKNYVTGKTGTPLDFVAFHAKGAPRLVDGHVRMNLGTQLRDISHGFQIVASYPEFSKLPIIIGESDPEGCAACGMKTNPENAYRNGTLYSSYTAAAFARKYDLADQHQVNLKGAVSWSFEFEDQPWFYGFRDLATNGVDKPVLNVFRMYGMMRGKRVEVTGNMAYQVAAIRDSSVRRAAPDVNALAARDTASNTATVMIWNYHDDNVPAPVSPVDLTIKGVPAKQVLVTQYRIDDEHSNSYAVWQKMGSPQQPTPDQVKQLEKAGQLAQYGSPVRTDVAANGEVKLNTVLPRQAVALFKLTW
nr:polysaccharide deacetylase family protein [Larkinella insperata]